jgi:hypothetical protein
LAISEQDEHLQPVFSIPIVSDLLHADSKGDHGELNRSDMLYCYVALRAWWTVVNSRIAYQTQIGEPDPDLFVRSNAFCEAMSALEHFLGTSSVDSVGAFLDAVDQGQDVTTILSNKLSLQNLKSALTIEMETTDLNSIVTKVRSLVDENLELRSQSSRLEEEFELIVDATGYSTASEIVGYIRSTRSYYAAASSNFSMAEVETRRLASELNADITLPALETVGTLRQQRTSVLEAVELLESNQRQLNRILSSWECGDILALFRSSQDLATSTEVRLSVLEENAAKLEQAFGTSDAAEITEKFRSVGSAESSLHGMADLMSGLERDIQGLSV